MLRLEIDHNLGALSEYWYLVKDEAEHSQGNIYGINDKERMEKLYVRELVRIPMPHWNRVAWEGLVALLPATLFRNEVEGANYVYAQLEMLTAIRSDLANLIAETRDIDYFDFGKLRSRRGSMVLNPRYDGPWQYAESIVAELLEKGNPIPG